MCTLVRACVRGCVVSNHDDFRSNEKRDLNVARLSWEICTPASSSEIIKLLSLVLTMIIRNV